MGLDLLVAEIIWGTVTVVFIGIGLLRFWRDIDGKSVSLDNVQLILWTGVILGSYAGMAAMVGGFLGDIPANLLALMGISAGSFVGGTTISAEKHSRKLNAAKGGLFSSESDPAKKSIAKMQAFTWNLVTILIFLIMVANNFATVNASLPDPGLGLVALMGISNGAYVGNKIPDALTKT
jgi:hypothetical protein